MSDFVKKRGEVISQEKRSLISMRYRRITRAINLEFWESASEVDNSLYVGSYGRGTAIDTSDIDVLVSLPISKFTRFNKMSGNGQSHLLYVVRQAILSAYPESEVRADGQVVKVLFSDGMKFEVLPAFKNDLYKFSASEMYTYPDSNAGGTWRNTNPKAEQRVMKEKNISSNGLLYDTCKHIRYIRDNYFHSYHLSGIVIDSFVYDAIGKWMWSEPGNEMCSAASGTYETYLLDYLKRTSYGGALLLTAPGSNQAVSTETSIECLRKVMEYIAM